MTVFNLPDLGEGLPDAEIVEWHVKEGDSIKLDAPLVSMETAKAVVEVPSPHTGIVSQLHGQAGDIINTGDPLVTFTVEGDEAAPSTADTNNKTADSGTVVGNVETSDTVIQERVSAAAGSNVKATPAVRATAKKLKVNLEDVVATGKNGVITVADVKQHAAKPTSAPATNTTASTSSATSEGYVLVKGTRRSMARSMESSHKEVAATTLADDADIHAWNSEQDITARLIRAICAGSKVEPGLNAWFNGKELSRKIHEQVDIGIAVDTEDGLFVPTIRQCQSLSAGQIREEINQIRTMVQNRTIPADKLKDYTIMLSNFGMFAGRYATPMVTLPCVCIIAAGKSRDTVVASNQEIAIHKVMPLSLTFDHRAVTGGEAARFLKAMINDLETAE